MVFPSESIIEQTVARRLVKRCFFDRRRIIEKDIGPVILITATPLWPKGVAGATIVSPRVIF